MVRLRSYSVVACRGAAAVSLVSLGGCGRTFLDTGEPSMEGAASSDGSPDASVAWDGGGDADVAVVDATTDAAGDASSADAVVDAGMLDADDAANEDSGDAAGECTTGGGCGTATVRFDVHVQGGGWMFCEGDGTSWLRIFSPSGQPLYLAPLFPSDCRTDCTTGPPIPIGVACSWVDAGTQGGWDGTYYSLGTCGDSANGSACQSQDCAPPGQYKAEACACSPEETIQGGGCSQLTCVDVPFTYPSCAPVEIVLAPPDAGIPAVAPVTLASGQSFPFDVAVDSTSVYWTDFVTSGAVVKVGLNGGTPTTLASAQVNPMHLALDSTNLYWTDEGRYGSSGAIVKMPLAGGAPTTLASLGNPSFIAIDSANAYWTDYAIGLQAVPIAGGTPLTLASGSFLWGVAASGGTVYWTLNQQMGSILSIPSTGGSPTTLASGQNYPTAIALDAAHVYWSDSQALVKAPLSGGPPVTLAAGLGQSIAVDDANLYWTDQNGKVMKVGLDGGAVTTLATALYLPEGIAVDSTSVYFTTGDGTVEKVPK